MTSSFILQLAAIVIGGGTVQFVIFLLKRRSELRSLDTASDSVALTSANAYIVTLQAGGKLLTDEVAALKRDLLTLQQAWNADRALSTDALRNAEQEIARLGAALARVEVDLSYTRVKTAELERLLTPPSPGASFPQRRPTE